MFNTIKEETEDRVILGNSNENIITASFSIIFGLILLWFFTEKLLFTVIIDHSILKDIFLRIILLGGFIALGAFIVLSGFENLLFKSKAEINKNNKMVNIERKFIIKYSEPVEKIYLPDIKEVKIEHVTSLEFHDSWNIYFITNTDKSEYFFTSSSESETKELADKICKLINPKIPLCESEVSY